MQATIATYDGSTRSGSVLFDDGVRADFVDGVVVDSIRHLRPGQRVIVNVSVSVTVSVTVEGDPIPTITSIRIH